MMNKKKKTTFLMIAVVAIWSFLGYKVWSSLNDDEETVNNSIQIVNFTPKKEEKKVDTFTIHFLERDPFLGKIRKSGKVKHTVEKSRIVQNRIEKKEVIWPEILYNGSIKRASSKKTIFVLTINGNEKMMRIGEVFQDVKLLKGNKNSVKLHYEKQTKTIYL